MSTSKADVELCRARLRMEMQEGIVFLEGRCYMLEIEVQNSAMGHSQFINALEK